MRNKKQLALSNVVMQTSWTLIIRHICTRYSSMIDFGTWCIVECLICTWRNEMFSASMSCQTAAIFSDRSDICADNSFILALSFSSWSFISLCKDLMCFSSSSLRNWWSFSNSSLIWFSSILVCSWKSSSRSVNNVKVHYRLQHYSATIS